MDYDGRRMLAFAPQPEGPAGSSFGANPWWQRALRLSCVAVLVASAFPWQALADSGFVVLGPRGFRTSTGFSLALIALFCLLLSELETGTRSSAQVVRPGCLVATAIGAVLMALAVHDGPGLLRGLAATHTRWFLVAAVASAGAALAAVVLHRALARRAG